MANEIFKELKTKIALKYLAYDVWSAESFKTEKPLKGEVWFCEVPSGNATATTAPTVLFKVGDGVNTFGALKWGSALAADVYEWAKQSGVKIEGSGNAITNVVVKKHDGKDYLTFEKGTTFATKAELEELREGLEADTNTTYQFTIPTTGDDKGKLLIEKKEISETSFSKLTALDLVTPTELTEILKSYYTIDDLAGKIHTETEIKAMEIAHATAAGKVDKTLTVKVGGATKTFNGSADVTADVDAAISAAITAEGHPEYSIAKVATTTGYSATYQLTKDGTAVGTKIDIPKDMVVSKGEVVTYSTSGAWGKAGTYIALTLANATSDTLYIPVDGLIEYVTSGSTTDSQVIVTIDETTHKVTATIGAGKIGATELAQTVKDDIAEGVTAHGWGNHASAGYLKSGDISGKADKKVPAAAGNLASLDANGNLGDSGKKVGDFATSSQGTKADNALQEVEVGEGLKVSAKASNKQKIEIDTDVIFVLNANF